MSSRIQQIVNFNNLIRVGLPNNIFKLSAVNYLTQPTEIKEISSGSTWICIDGSPLQTEIFNLCTPIIFFDLLNQYVTVALKANFQKLSWPMMNMLPVGSYVVAVLCTGNTQNEIKSLTQVFHSQGISDFILGVEFIDVTSPPNRGVYVHPANGFAEWETNTPHAQVVRLTPSIGLTVSLSFADLFKITPTERINILQAQL